MAVRWLHVPIASVLSPVLASALADARLRTSWLTLRNANDTHHDHFASGCLEHQRRLVRLDPRTTSRITREDPPSAPRRKRHPTSITRPPCSGASVARARKAPFCASCGTLANRRRRRPKAPGHYGARTRVPTRSSIARRMITIELRGRELATRSFLGAVIGDLAALHRARNLARAPRSLGIGIRDSALGSSRPAERKPRKRGTEVCACPALPRGGS